MGLMVYSLLWALGILPLRQLAGFQALGGLWGSGCGALGL